jgi:hypothetical protein
MSTTNRQALEQRIRTFEASRDRTLARYADMIARTQLELERLDVPALEPANDLNEPPTRPDPPPTRAAVELPSPSTPPDAPGLEEAPALVRYVPTAEILALTDAAEVLTALGKLETPREEHELVSAWTVAGNRAALNAVAVHVGGPLADRAARALKRLGTELAPAEA